MRANSICTLRRRLDVDFNTNAVIPLIVPLEQKSEICEHLVILIYTKEIAVALAPRKSGRYGNPGKVTAKKVFDIELVQPLESSGETDFLDLRKGFYIHGPLKQARIQERVSDHHIEFNCGDPHLHGLANDFVENLHGHGLARSLHDAVWAEHTSGVADTRVFDRNRQDGGSRPVRA